MADDDKIFLITGASTGIGAAVCTELAKRGARVVGVGRIVLFVPRRDDVERDA